MRGVCDGSAGTKGGSHHRSLDKLGLGRTGFPGVTGVYIDAIRALSRERNRDGDQFLVFHRNRTFRYSRFVESPKGFHQVWREGAHFVQPGQVFFMIHVFGLFFLS